ncbi:hypothetical protein [Flavivirga algicola]|uniref:Uncharacterized protein n=1 Tax=Flavivirga algicola TaxID=2729136 RepID=A0ABX1RUY0_9FLAO|nr:hypothetical protein [Flavivirga algicola]NMH87360.1 hypothetical protein [Flavivirga algicola]
MSTIGKKRQLTFEKKYALLGIIITVTIGLLYYSKQSMIGFPDSHFTEYDRFCKEKLYPYFLSLNTIFLLGFILSAFLKKKSKQIFILYISLLIIYLIIEYYLSINLENGQGG